MKKTLAMLLALLTVGASLISCGGSDDTAAETTAADANAETTAAEEVELTNAQKMNAYIQTLPDNDYEGYEMVIMTRSEAGTTHWYTRDVFSEGEDGDPINDAVYARNRALEEQFNIVVKDNPTSANPSNEAKTLIASGEDSFTFVTDGVYHLASIATAGMAIDYNTVSEIDLDSTWWDQRMINELTIADRLYFLTGDISIMDNEGTWQVVFNKETRDNYSLADFYEHRDNGTWTLDLLTESARTVVKDLNGDGNLEGGIDQMGLATESWNTYALWAGAGLKTTTKNNDDIPEFTMYSEKSATVVDRILNLQTDKSVVYDHNLVEESFGKGTTLFQIVGMRTLPVMRQNEFEFGILPLPKYEESQEHYYSIASHYNLTAYLMPMTTTDVSRSATLLEAMAGISSFTLTPAYYDISLDGKYLRDEESAESITIILDNRSYDIGIIFAFGDPISVFTKMTLEDTRDFSSRCAALETSMQAAIDKFVETIK